MLSKGAKKGGGAVFHMDEMVKYMIIVPERLNKVLMKAEFDRTQLLQQFWLMPFDFD